jgi:hypothetical protein
VNPNRVTAANRASLVDKVAERVPQPIDVFEIVAVVESMGITDTVAREDYGVETAFDLADRIYPLVLGRGKTKLRKTLSLEDSEAGSAPPNRIPFTDALAPLIGFIPLLVVLAITAALVRAGWSSSSVFALAFGITAGVLATSGPVLAIGRRASVYLGLGYIAPARRFVSRASLLTLAGCILCSAAVFAALTAADLFRQQERTTFCVALAGYAIVWLLVASVTLAGRAALAVGSLVLGLVAGVAAGATLGGTVNPTPGLIVGFAVAVLALGTCWVRVYFAGDGRSMRLPAPGLMTLEATPYIVFGSLASLLFFEPHVLGWLGTTDESRLSTIVTLELSLTLALPPLILVTGVHHLVMESFWMFATSRADKRDAAGFSEALRFFHERSLTRYVVVFAFLSGAMVATVETTVLLGGLGNLNQLVFLLGIASFFALGLGQFNCLFMLTLARPGRASMPVFGGLVVVTAVGIPLAFVNFSLTTIAFALGASAFAMLASVRCRDILSEADYYYAAVL